MYSKSLGTGDGRARADWRSAAAIREPSYRQTVRVPPNYSGHAFKDGEERSPEQVMEGRSYRDHSPRREEPPTPRFDGLPQVSSLGSQGAFLERREAPSHEPPLTASEAADEGCLCAQACLPALPVPRDNGAKGEHGSHHDPMDRSGTLGGMMERFPFGHGFGFEELLLVGLMLLLLHEGDGEGDLGETLVLLGILLLCG